MSDHDENLDYDRDEESTEESEDGEQPPEESKAGTDDGVDKRVRDLQSKADAAEARANKLEKLLAKSSDSGESDSAGSNDPDRAALLQELREASLDAVYGEFDLLKDYGIDRALIEGTTRTQMRESAAQLVGLIKGVETKVRNKVLREHGLKAEPAGATRQPPKNWAEMSSEDFQKELERVKSGGNSLW